MKKCIKCQIDRDDKCFSKGKNICKSCSSVLFQKWLKEIKDVPKVPLDLTIQKVCSVCKKKKKLSEFYIRRDRNKPISRCKSCNVKATKQSWKNLSESEKKKRFAENKQWKDRQIKNGNLRVYMTTKICSYKGNAKKYGVPFDLDIEYLIELIEKQNRKCFYTGETLTMESNRGMGKRCITLPSNKNQASLDRLTPERGYIKGNVVWCGWLVNTCKNMLTEIQFYDFCKTILKHKQLI